MTPGCCLTSSRETLIDAGPDTRRCRAGRPYRRPGHTRGSGRRAGPVQNMRVPRTSSRHAARRYWLIMLPARARYGRGTGRDRPGRVAVSAARLRPGSGAPGTPRQHLASAARRGCGQPHRNGMFRYLSARDRRGKLNRAADSKSAGPGFKSLAPHPCWVVGSGLVILRVCR
jgi:hypothetical protein